MKALKYIWALPGTVLGLLLCIIYLPRRVRWFDGCLEIQPRWMITGAVAQTFGWLIFFARGREQVVSTRVHERVHVQQAFRWGPLFYPLYVGHYMYLWVKYRFVYWKAYTSIWAEKEAYSFAAKYPTNAWGTKLPEEK